MIDILVDYYQPHLIVKYMVYFLFVWFFIVSFSKDRFKTNFVLLLMYAFNSFWFSEIKHEFDSAPYVAEWIYKKGFLIGVDTVFGVLVVAINKNNLSKYDFKQFVFIGFVVLCHFMVLWQFTISKSWLTGTFYTYYDELIIIIGILQVCISSDGIISAIGRIRALKAFDYRLFVRDVCSSENLFGNNKSKGGT